MGVDELQTIVLCPAYWSQILWKCDALTPCYNTVCSLIFKFCFLVPASREADRVILTACQQQGASQSTFESVSAQLGNKTANEVFPHLLFIYLFLNKSTILSQDK